MRIKKSKYWCLILAMLVLLTCMHFEDCNASTVRACATVASPYSQELTRGVAFTNAELCTTEMLGERRNAGAQQLTSRYINQKREWNTSLSLLYIAILAFLCRKLLTSAEAVCFFQHRLAELVIRYIHRTDGKKRI